ncbi:ATP-grasp fold amidoligase family protein, partial [Pontibaca methylaminivorans]|uniref:ATP-grasp fold amidoligase family protein n=1 Tax=Pontibaca methylaminivorans TaxID=515897 RepID=UPI002FDA4271
TLEFSPNSVIKPARGGGSTVVYIIKDSTNIINVRERSILTSIKELQASMQCVLSEDHGRRDSWIVEEMIVDKEGGAPNDLKFYVFYGHSPLVLEVSRFGEKALYSWRDREGKITSVGQPQYSYFEGREIPEDFYNLVEDISLKIPAPFVRIDLFDSSEGLVFGEFTPRPGSSHNFDLSADRMLGRHFIDARARLFNDLYTGKKFPEFDSIINEYRR